MDAPFSGDGDEGLEIKRARPDPKNHTLTRKSEKQRPKRRVSSKDNVSPHSHGHSKG